ncbi:hypothetical protein JHK87_002379 [Glycine soja]|nr:hypothetical protein JHK87_002379 [Glycine soja]
MERLITSFSLGTTENNVRAAVVQMINALLCEAEIKLSDEMIETITNKTFLDACPNQDGKKDMP